MRLLPWLLLLTFAAPFASAQVGPGVVASRMDVALEAPTTLAEPDGEALRIPFTWTLTVDAPAWGDIAVDLVADPPSPVWRVSVEPPTAVARLSPGVTSTASGEGVLLVWARGDAPAFTPQAIELRVEAHGSELVQPSTGTARVDVAAEWRPGLLVTLAAPTVVVPAGGGNEPAYAEVHVTGNGDVLVTAAVEHAPRGCVAQPASPSMATAATARGTLRIALECRRGWDPGALSVRFDHALATDGSRQGEPVVAVWDVVPPCVGDCDAHALLGGARTFGDAPREYRNESPLPGWWGVVLALVGSAFATRTRRA